MTQIINAWRSTKEKLVPLSVQPTDSDIVKEIGDFRIYKRYSDHYVYTFKNFAFTELAGLNVEHFNNVVTGTAPKEQNQMYWLYVRSTETLNKIKTLIK